MRILGILLLWVALPLGAATFQYSRAPVVNDPSLTHRPSAALWPHVNIAEARRLLGRPGVLFVDGRTHGEWRQSHLPGAVSLPGFEFDNRYPLLRDRIVHAKALIIYCHGFTCGAADYIAQLLADRGLRNMAVFSGGYPQWKEEGLPLEGPGASIKMGKAGARPAPVSPSAR